MSRHALTACNEAQSNNLFNRTRWDKLTKKTATLCPRLSARCRAVKQTPGIRPAVETEAQLLSALAMRAKVHWGYSAEVLEGWRAELAVSPQNIRAKPTFVAMVRIEVAGFYSLSPLGRSCELDHLWVLPRFMHLGIGRALLSHALETAARGGATEVTVDADPNAEPFYLECGAVRRGVVPAPLPGQPQRARPQLAFNARAS